MDQASAINLTQTTMSYQLDSLFNKNAVINQANVCKNINIAVKK